MYNFIAFIEIIINKQNTIDIQRTYNWKNINLCVMT